MCQREIRFILIPKLRGLIARVPLAILPARAENPFLGAGALLVPANAGDHRGQTGLGQRVPQGVGFQGGTADNPPLGVDSCLPPGPLLFCPTMRLRFQSLEIRSRNSIISGILKLVST